MSADILFEVAWKSMVVAGSVVALLMAMGRQAPSSRVAVGGLGFAFLLLLPVAIAAAARMPVPTLELAAPTTPVIVAPLLPESLYLAPEPESSALSMAQLAALAWLVGAIAMLFRLGAGLATLRRWTNRAGPVVSREWLSLLDRCQTPRGTRLLLSEEVTAPLSWGWRSPTILINPETLCKEAEAQAVLAHEAAHLSRGDWPRLIAAKLVVALFWFNPFVWLLERLYLQDVEEAADAEATRLVEPARYAQALLNVARGSAVPLGANSIASGALSRRIKKVLGGRIGSRWERAWRIGALTGVAAIAAPIAAVQFVAPAVSAAARDMPLVSPLAITSPAPIATASPQVAPLAAEVVAHRSGSIVFPAPIGTPMAVPVAGVAPTPAAAAAFAAQPAIAPEPPEIDREEIERIRRASEEMRVQSQIIVRDSRKIAERARAQVAVAMANARQEMLRGADEMERAIPEMQSGAAQMREEARKLRDPAYRAKVIADARENQSRLGGKWNNKIPTDQELIDAIPKLEQGADKMDAGVEKMREGAAKMRRSAQGN